MTDADEIRAQTAARREQTAALRALAEEIAGYTDRGELAPPEVLERAQTLALRVGATHSELGEDRGPVDEMLAAILERQGRLQ